jgi:hypothetical protein
MLKHRSAKQRQHGKKRRRERTVETTFGIRTKALLIVQKGSTVLIWAGAIAGGLVFAVLSFPLVVGAEELTRWSTVTLTNATAGNFFRAIAIAGVGGMLADKYKAHWWSWFILAGGVVLGLGLLWWQMSHVNLFNIL